MLKKMLRVIWRLLQAIWRLSRKGMHMLAQASKWLITQLLFHVVSPILCFTCIYLGVLATVPLPASLWVGLQPSLVEKIPLMPFLAFPEAQIPNLEKLPGMLLIALPLALIVFCHHHQEWQNSNAPLLARMLFAAGSGVSWSWAWFKRWRNSRNQVKQTP